MTRIGFFGPFGTFTEQALRSQADLADGELVPYRTVPDVLDAVASGELDLGFVPIENSIEGMVNFTQDALAFDYELRIHREVVLDIEHCLLARAGVTVDDIKTVYSHPGRHGAMSPVPARAVAGAPTSSRRAAPPRPPDG